MSCKATYVETIYYNPANQYTIILAKTADDIPKEARSRRIYTDGYYRFTAIGIGLPRTNAVDMELEGEWENGRYGTHLKVESWNEYVEPTPEGILAYLGSGLIKGIGPKIAKDMVDRYGTDTLRILEEEPEKLLEISGITQNRLTDIVKSYEENYAYRNLMALLGPFQVTPTTAMTIYGELGPNSVDVLKKNPYELCRISGFGFKRVDAILRKTDTDLHKAGRIRGAVLCGLQQARENEGHLFLPAMTAVQTVYGLLNDAIPNPEMRVQNEEIQMIIKEMVRDGAVVARGGNLYDPRVFAREDETARLVASRLLRNDRVEWIETSLREVKEELGICLSEQQEAAVRTAFRSDLSIITGSPGTGKTTVLKTIIEVYRKLHPDGKISLMAPTGRASRRMAESTGMENAKTLHSALGLTTEENFCREEDKTLEGDLILVDEFSMVDMWLARCFFGMVGEGAKIVLVGDPDQLPSVGAGNVLHELIQCGRVPVTRLNRIFRQQNDSLIAYNAKNINEGIMPLTFGRDFVFIGAKSQQEAADYAVQVFLKELHRYGTDSVQVLTPFRSKGAASSDQLNQKIRASLRTGTLGEIRAGAAVYYIGDRVMQTKNTEKVSNGDIGFVMGQAADDKGNTVIRLLFNGKQLNYKPEDMAHITLAYAATIHKSMGSEYPVVIIPVVREHSIMWYRNLLYTAVTRAKTKVVLIGEKAVLHIAVNRSEIAKRNTSLGQRIGLYCDAARKEERKAG